MKTLGEWHELVWSWMLWVLYNFQIQLTVFLVVWGSHTSNSDYLSESESFFIILVFVTRYLGLLQKVSWSIFIWRGFQSLSLTCQLAHGNGLNIQRWVVSVQDNGFFTYLWSEISWVGSFLLCSMTYMTFSYVLWLLLLLLLHRAA